MTSIRGITSQPLLPDGADLRLPWHLGLPAQLEAAFHAHSLTLSRSMIRASFALVLTLLLGGSIIEVLVDPISAAQSWRARLVAILATSLAWWSAASHRPDRLVEPAVCCAALAISGSNNYLAITLTHNLAYSYYLFNLLAILLMGTLFRISLRLSLITSAIILLMTLLSMLALDSLDYATALVLFFFILAGGVLSLYGHYNFEKLQRHHFLAERVLALHRNELHSANIVLESQAAEDPLTRTVNRRGLDERLARLISKQRKRENQEGNIYLLLFDIDFFKQYNDTYGHLAGDDCLRKIAAITKSMIQSEVDFVARYGGEEFLIVLSGTRLNDALVLAERIRDRIEKQGMAHENSRTSNVVTISIGVAGWTSSIESSADFIRLADEALYEAKRLGRNRVVMIDEERALRQI